VYDIIHQNDGNVTIGHQQSAVPRSTVDGQSYANLPHQQPAPTTTEQVSIYIMLKKLAFLPDHTALL